MKNELSQVRRLLSLLQILLVASTAFCLVGNKQIQPAQVVMQEAVEYRREGRRLQGDGQLGQALSAYQKAIIIKPGYADAYNDMGVVLEAMGREIDALAAYQEAIRFDPRLGPAHTNLALLYEKRGDLDKAAQHWAARAAVGPADDPWVVRARNKLRSYDIPVPKTPEAMGEEREIQIRLAYEAGLEHMRHHRWFDAEAEFERVLQLDPDHIKAKRRLRKVKTWITADERRRPTRREMVPLKVEMGEETGPSLEVIEDKSPGYGPNFSWGDPERRQVAVPGDRAVSSSMSSMEVSEAPEPVMQAPAGISKESMMDDEPAPVVSSSAAASDAEALAALMVEEKSSARGSSVDELYSRGVTAMRERNFQEAITQFQHVLELDPGHRKAQLALKRAQAALEK